MLNNIYDLDDEMISTISKEVKIDEITVRTVIELYLKEIKHEEVDAEDF